MKNKLKIGWFSFTCCEDSTIIFTELLNTHWKDWTDRMEFIHAKVLRKDSGPELKDMDVSFVEGAISAKPQEEKLKKIREKSKLLVAIGSCAVLGSPSNQRNFFNQSQLEQIRPVLERFNYYDRVIKISDLVKVDYFVPGCPMNEKLFLELMNKLLV